MPHRGLKRRGDGLVKHPLHRMDPVAAGVSNIIVPARYLRELQRSETPTKRTPQTWNLRSGGQISPQVRALMERMAAASVPKTGGLIRRKASGGMVRRTEPMPGTLPSGRKGLQRRGGLRRRGK